MRALTYTGLIVAVLFSAATGALAQSSVKKEATASITGRVTVGDKAAPQVMVVLLPSEYSSPERRPVATAKTDADGHYRLMNIPAGRYIIRPLTPTLIVESETRFEEPGKSIIISEGEAIDNIDFTLTRGGIITGRVTDADGRPVIAEHVALTPVERSDRERPPLRNPFMYETDDRGVYRLYSVPTGRYVVSVGQARGMGTTRPGSGRGVYTRTFHPNVTEQEKATIIEVTEGSEATSVDITLGRPIQTYEATGRIVDAESGQPVADAPYAYGPIMGAGNRQNLIATNSGQRATTRGEFRIGGLSPGRYAVYSRPEIGNEFYSDPVVFEVTDGDVAGLELKLQRGASISGVVVIEGTNDKAILAKLSQMRVYTYPEMRAEGLRTPYIYPVPVNPDGSFRLNGLGPGKVNLAASLPRGVRNLSLRRVERDGVEQREGIEIGPGEQVTSVRIIIGYGTGAIRGQVKIEGQLPPGARLFLNAARVDGGGRHFAELDARHRFLIEGLAAGEYEITIPSVTRKPPVKQIVTVTEGVESDVTLVVNLNAEEKEKAP